MINWDKYYKAIPSSIKIRKNTYEIMWVKDFPYNHYQYGESRFNESKQIIINLNQPVKEAVYTYFHELLHVLSEEYGANLTEKQVKALEKSLYYILKRDNIFKGVINGTSYQGKRRNTKRRCKVSKKTR